MWKIPFDYDYILTTDKWLISRRNSLEAKNIDHRWILGPEGAKIVQINSNIGPNNSPNPKNEINSSFRTYFPLLLITC